MGKEKKGKGKGRKRERVKKKIKVKTGEKDGKFVQISIKKVPPFSLPPSLVAILLTLSVWAGWSCL